MTYLSGPAIARLVTCSRVVAHERMQRGDYGELLQRGGIWFAALADIEARVGHSFTPAQIEAAVDGYPDRRIVLARERVRPARRRWRRSPRVGGTNSISI
jgi:hypothetical protein